MAWLVHVIAGSRVSKQPASGDGSEYGTDRNVLVVGLWHLGTVAAACWARLGWTVTAHDPSPERVVGLAQGRAPVAEPGLEELISEGLAAGRLTFTGDLRSAAAGCRLAVVAFDTPVDDQDRPDLTPVEDAVQALGRWMPDGSVVVLMSQVPVGTSRSLQASLDTQRAQGTVSIVCSPENLRLGQAVDRFLSPGFVILGTRDAAALRAATRLFEGVAGQIMPMDPASAELCKHYINAYLATCISLGNELASIAERLGADATTVAAAVAHDPRIGSAPLAPGLAFGGGTLARDLQVLRGEGVRLEADTRLLDAVSDVNARQNAVVISKLRSQLGSLDGAVIALLGLTYKAGTSTIRRSPGVDILSQLQVAGASVQAFDPMADPAEVAELPRLVRCGSVMEAISGSDGVVIATEWPEFAAADWERLARLARRPVLVDAKNLLDPRAAADAGWSYEGIGRSVSRLEERTVP